MLDFETWLDQEYTVAKLTLLSGQSEGKLLTEAQKEKLTVEYNLLEKIYAKYIDVGTYGALLTIINDHATPLQKIANKENLDINTLIQVVKRLNGDQRINLMESYGISFTDGDIDIEEIKLNIRHNYISQLEEIQNSIKKVLPFIEE